MPDDVKVGETLTLNIQFVMRIETNLKLNLIDYNGNSMIDLQDYWEVRRPEVHFLQMESIVDRQSVSLSIAWRIIKSMFKRPRTLKFEDWVITDLDYALKGNLIMPPHYSDELL